MSTEVLNREPRQTHVQVVLFAESELMRAGLQALLHGLESVALDQVCGSLANLSDALSVHAVDVVVVSGEHSAALCAPLVRHAAHPPLVLALLTESQFSHGMRRETLQADGYVLEEGLTADVLDRALTQLINNEMPMPSRLGRKLLASATGDSAKRQLSVAPLTVREHQALVHVVDGLSNKQIARKLGISDNGVKRLISSVLLKLGASNRTAAAVTALDLGLVDSAL
ncbi:response regulator transcription factor [Streptomyces sp. ME02-8801-2C]|uniref:response regulator transcription factor n=1 Tax=Streptomyces sp. ME02-8801-2C TaxID=3028680 RepID=UPI0029A236E2|nr:response regulator transcription factor [Streptomyces sp. ME02-8801-2C]MDX3458214.1 response regulator transcription factor [Streptomyces sp. ME02-8801-2C]